MAAAGHDDAASSRAETLRRQAERAFRSGRADEAHRIAVRALTEAGRTTDSRALLLEHLGRYLDAGSTSWEHDYFEQSLAELDPNALPHERIRVLCSSGLAGLRRGRTDDGVRLLHEAAELAREADDAELETVVCTVVAEAALTLGTLDESLHRTRRARRLGIESRQHHLVVRSYFNEARATYLRTGNVADAARIRGAGLAYAAEHGELATEEGNTLRLALIEDLIEAGRWPEADDLLNDPAPHERHGSLNEVEEALVRAWLQSWRSREPDPAPSLVRLVATSSPLHEAYFLSLALAAAARLGDHAAVEELTGRALLLADGHLAPPSSGLYVIDALASAIHAQTAGPRPPMLHPDTAPDRLLEALESVYARVRHHVAAPYELTDGVVAVARAEAAHAGAREQVEAEHWDTAIWIFRRTHARARLVHALLGRVAAYERGDDRAAALLDEAERIAVSMGAEPYVERIARLREPRRPDRPSDRAPVARRPPPASSASPADLTPRQRQVIARLAEGRTDREIAEELRLSVRTVNAHVAQLLTRLGLRNRAEAAGWYYRSENGRGEEHGASG
ncbi:LuxR C-terminal-related transcriptional regulator [Streptomyces sp. DT2A-34]|uniref:LuxR C-terminal-related transcriptional regulator n=1 Tax=Streptomyces sp. DT2A-34 TaxID=3051182 RepID=UPI00265C125F|nr:LuxR C-terminal-related transcriptional regulator [Streptomyces sp. DT2A-34]MDO0912256.1 LuxR C-terminal-related transcriptional regulator [Streptomyces sp. DT2A-34]